MTTRSWFVALAMFAMGFAASEVRKDQARRKFGAEYLQEAIRQYNAKSGVLKLQCDDGEREWEMGPCYPLGPIDLIKNGDD